MNKDQIQTQKPQGMTEELVEVNSFWNKVDKRGDDDCWNWQAGKNKQGYGTYRFNKKMSKAHRVSWVLANGEIPAGLCVCHQCDNPSCVNPKHLWLGTYQDNNSDRHKKGRTVFNRHLRTVECFARGEVHGRCKLTAQQVLDIRTNGVSSRQLGSVYNVHFSTINLIRAGKIWKHI